MPITRPRRICTRTRAPRWKHGSVGGYSNHKCKCARCRAAWTRYNQQMRVWRWLEMTVGIVEVVHGSESTYFNYSCRCGPCYQEHSRSEALRNVRRRRRVHAGNGAKGHG